MTVETIHAERVGEVTVIGFDTTTLYHQDGVDLARILSQTKTARLVINLDGVARCSSETFNA